MSTDTRRVVANPPPQGVDEEIAYTITTTPWGSTPTSASVKVYDVTSGTRTDVTATTLPAGSISVTGDVITLPLLKTGLTAGHTYRVEVKFTASGNVFEFWFLVEAEN